IEDVANTNGYSLVLCNSDEDPEKERVYIAILLAEAVAGVIITSTSESARPVGELLSHNIPVVAIDRKIKSSHIDSVLAGNAEGAYDAVSHLLKLGHRCIGFIGLPLSYTPGKERYEGYQRAMREHHLPISRSHVRFSNAKQDGGYESARDLLAGEPCITAFFVANNLMTLGALDAIRERGLKIPDDVSVVGFDDMPWAMLLQPPLTAIAQPTYDLGKKAAELLLERLQKTDKPVDHLRLNTQLVVRGSTSKPRA
ncbi:MAG TPA: substrate-binding domain-containing protein, partial [Anaerolineae bacterium]